MRLSQTWAADPDLAARRQRECTLDRSCGLDRAHNDVEAGLANAPPEGDVVWVSPADILARRTVPVPPPVRESLSTASAATAAASSAAAAVATVAHTNCQNAALATRPTKPPRIRSGRMRRRSPVHAYRPRSRSRRDALGV
jgi:hypothetical protein